MNHILTAFRMASWWLRVKPTEFPRSLIRWYSISHTVKQVCDGL